MSTALSDALLEKAAQLRAEGLSWEAVGKALHRTASRLRHWPQEHPARWAAALKRCENEILSDAAAESMNALRHQLRDKDQRTRQNAAALLLKHQTNRTRKPQRRKKEAKPASATAIRMAEYVEGLSDDELDQMLCELAEPAAAAADAPRPDAAGESRPGGPAESEPVPGVLLP